MEHLRAGDRVRDRRQTRPNPHESTRGHARSGHRTGDIPESRGGPALSGLPRPGARFRHLSLRPRQAALHPTGGAAAVSRRGRRRTRDPRGGQRCGRAIVHSRRHAGAPGPGSSGVRLRQVQRLQHVLLSSSLEHVRRLVGLARDRHRRPRGRAQRRGRLGSRLELLSSVAARGQGAEVHRCRQTGAARNPANRIQIHAVR